MRRYIRSNIHQGKKMALCGMLLFLFDIVLAEGTADDSIPENKGDTVSFFTPNKKVLTDRTSSEGDYFFLSGRSFHRLGAEARPGYIFPTNSFLRGDNKLGEPIRNSFSTHLEYSFQFYPNTNTDRIYSEAYQGAGLACFNFGEREQVGSPIAFLFVPRGTHKPFQPSSVS